MSTLTFKALIDGVHYDPKKGALKIQLIAASYVSMDKLTSIAPSDEPIQITLESAQTKITDVGEPITLNLGEEAAKKLREGEGEEEDKGIITEFD